MPLASQEPLLDDQPVGEQRHEQHELDEQDEAVIARLRLQDAGEAEQRAPAATASTAVDSTVRRVMPESAEAPRRRPPSTARPSLNPMLMLSVAYHDPSRAIRRSVRRMTRTGIAVTQG